VGALQPMHLAVILVIVLIVFGPGKLTEVFGQLGRGVREFRDASDSHDGAGSGASNALPAIGRTCASCGVAAASDASFCTGCGRQLGAA
jgi:sec-independent protein translocase protein TatA